MTPLARARRPLTHPTLVFTDVPATPVTGVSSTTINLGPAMPGRTIIVLAADGNFARINGGKLGPVSPAAWTPQFGPISEFSGAVTFYDPDGSMGTSATLSILVGSAGQNSLSDTPTTNLNYFGVLVFVGLPINSAVRTQYYGETYNSVAATPGTPKTDTYGPAGANFTDVSGPSLFLVETQFSNSGGTASDAASTVIGGDFKVAIQSMKTGTSGAGSVKVSTISYAVSTSTKTTAAFSATNATSGMTSMFYRRIHFGAVPVPFTISNNFYNASAGYWVAPCAGNFNAFGVATGSTGIASNMIGWASGGGGASATGNIALAAGDKFFYSIPAGPTGPTTSTGLAGSDCWANTNANSPPISAATGILAKGAPASSTTAASTGGPAAGCLGNVSVFKGGAGRLTMVDAQIGGGSSAGALAAGNNGTGTNGAAGPSGGGSGGAGATSTTTAGTTGAQPGGGGGNSRGTAKAGNGGGAQITAKFSKAA